MLLKVRNIERALCRIHLLPSSSFAMTTPLPALAENRKPALKMVNMANPFAFSRTDRGMTPSRPLFPLSTKDLTDGKVDQRSERVRIRSTGLRVSYLQILAAFMHSLGRG